MTETLHISSTEFRASAGKFDIANRYLRAGATGSFFPMPKGKTVDINRTAFPGDPSTILTAIRYSVDGYVMEKTKANNGTDFPSGWAGSFNADVTTTTL